MTTTRSRTKGRDVAKEIDLFSDVRADFLKGLSPELHFKECDLEEKACKAPSPKSVHPFVEHLLFGGRVFYDEPVGRLKVVRNSANRSYRFKVIAAPTAPLKISRSEWRYRRLLGLLNKPQDMEFRWLLIAQWLQQE